MKEERQTVKRDLAILEVMVAEMDDYLMSEATHWTMEKGDMPKLTIGGCLMRCHRLPFVRDQLNEKGQRQLDKTVQSFADALSENVVRFEQRMHQELHARLADWSGYLAHMASRMMADVGYYASVVDTRVVIQAMIDELHKTAYQFDKRILEEVTALDHNLKGRWQVGEFVWPAVWQSAYPPETYWWLYGRPK
ncbi:MAG: hypothetical protein H6669_14340 [Ardenticatenaceae bacterium]|nr:hypothetical protein [Ardenticatenaceae bacterium]